MSAGRPTRAKPFNPQDTPAYTPTEAARYLKVPVATLRAWVIGLATSDIEQAVLYERAAWAQIGKYGWIAITHNARIRYMPNERDAVIRHRVSLLVVVGKAPLKELAENFVATLPPITEFLARHKAPLIAKIYRPTPAERMERPDAPTSE